MKWLCHLLIPLVLMSCSIIPPRDTGRADMLTLPALPQGENVCQVRLNAGLKVAYPQLPDDLDTYRIATMDNNGKRDYLTGMRWAEFLPGLLQTALVKSLNDYYASDHVFADDQVVATRWEILSDIRRFEVEYPADGPAKVNIEIAFALRKGERMEVTNEFTVAESSPVGKGDAISITHAFRKSFLLAQEQLLEILGGCN